MCLSRILRDFEARFLLSPKTVKKCIVYRKTTISLDIQKHKKFP